MIIDVTETEVLVTLTFPDAESLARYILWQHKGILCDSWEDDGVTFEDVSDAFCKAMIGHDILDPDQERDDMMKQELRSKGLIR